MSICEAPLPPSSVHRELGFGIPQLKTEHTTLWARGRDPGCWQDLFGKDGNSEKVLSLSSEEGFWGKRLVFTATENLTESQWCQTYGRCTSVIMWKFSECGALTCNCNVFPHINGWNHWRVPKRKQTPGKAISSLAFAIHVTLYLPWGISETESCLV